MDVRLSTAHSTSSMQAVIGVHSHSALPDVSTTFTARQYRTKARLRTKTFSWISPVLDAARAMSLLLDSRRPKNCEMRSKPADSENDEAGKQTKETQRQPLSMVLREEKRLSVQGLLWLLQQSVSSFQSRQRAGKSNLGI